jgi:aminocarboxymuconate-semialdehyde decarboxylase
LQSSYPGKLLDLVLEQGLITQKQHQEIWKDNVARWLYGRDAEKFLTRISP